MYKLTIEQKDLLQDKFYAPSSLFNPIQDADGIWIISPQEVEQCVVEEFMWIKNLPQIEFNPFLDPFI
jgi:hypothetical protein